MKMGRGERPEPFHSRLAGNASLTVRHLAMQRIILFIRDPGQSDTIDFHPDEASARRALASYVRDKTAQPDLTPRAENDDEIIAAYFANPAATYTIAGVASDAR